MPFGIHLISHPVRSCKKRDIARRVSIAFRHSSHLTLAYFASYLQFVSKSPLPFGIHLISHRRMLAGSVALPEWSPLPFGIHLISHRRMLAGSVALPEWSPLPFGIHLISHRRMLAGSVALPEWSPLPFGIHLISHERKRHWYSRAYRARLHCLSAFISSHTRRCDMEMNIEELHVSIAFRHSSHLTRTVPIREKESGHQGLHCLSAFISSHTEWSGVNTTGPSWSLHCLSAFISSHTHFPQRTPTRRK